jgi:hypothetical protein
MLMNYCENLEFKNGTFICKINDTNLKCKCKNQIEQHKDKWQEDQDE